MCLEIVATIAKGAKCGVSAEELSKATGICVTAFTADGASALHFAVTGGCSCEFLADHPDVEAETWALSGAHLTALSRAVTLLSKNCKRFTFVAYWINGKRSRREEPVSAAALAKRIAENRVGNNVLYVVG